MLDNLANLKNVKRVLDMKDRNPMMLASLAMGVLPRMGITPQLLSMGLQAYGKYREGDQLEAIAKAAEIVPHLGNAGDTARIIIDALKDESIFNADGSINEDRVSHYESRIRNVTPNTQQMDSVSIACPHCTYIMKV